MRPIKFRAWDKENKIMRVLEIAFFAKNGYFITDKETSHGFLPSNKISDFELMQYTGLLDKNGKGREIYEGDIVKGIHWEDLDTGIGIDRRSIEGEPFEVKWDSQMCGWNLYGWEDFEIIGNVWESPELIK